MRRIDKIILHCSAEPFGRNTPISTIKVWHKQRGFNDVGYHYYIKEDGTLEKGRKDDVIGAHCSGENSNSIGICYGGGLDKDMKPKDTRTEEQKEVLNKLVYDLLTVYDLNIEDVYCHYEFANKACPSFKIDDYKKEYKLWVEKRK